MRLLCARCSTERVDTALASFFLCADCAVALSGQAFNGAGPSFWDFGVVSHCSLCNDRKDLKLAQWFLCPFCERVVNSYRLGRVSRTYTLTEWDRLILPVATSLRIEPTDPVTLNPYVRPVRGQNITQPLDYRVLDGGTHAAWLEVKTGQRSIAEFATFQLDHSDCDDILDNVRSTMLPAYLVHVQLDREYHPPSDRSVPRGLWWTDMYALAAAYVGSRRRPGRRNGGKMAAHFSPNCFASLETLGPALRDGRHRALLERLLTEGPPQLYRP
jgi:hypothetical protein